MDENLNQTNYVPSYQSRNADHFATATQTEHSLRDASPINLDIYGKMHGRNARGSGHRECPVWLTEFGIAPPEDGITNVAAAYELKAKMPFVACAFISPRVVRPSTCSIRGLTRDRVGGTWNCSHQSS